MPGGFGGPGGPGGPGGGGAPGGGPGHGAAGAFHSPPPGAPSAPSASPGWAGGQQQPLGFPVAAKGGGGPRRPGLFQRIILRIGDIPIKFVYTVLATLAFAAIVFLIFVLFSGDQPDNASQDTRASVRPTAGSTGGVTSSAEPSADDGGDAKATPAPTPTGGAGDAALPPPPREKALTPLPGKASASVGTVADTRAMVSYARLGEPWVSAASTPFSKALRIGPYRAPYALVASALLPGDAPEKLDTDADYTAAAVRAAKWSLQTHHPKGGTLTWTASQRLTAGRGWLLAYQVSYQVGGQNRTSQAAVAVVDTGQAKPAMVFVTIPDTQKARWPDIAAVLTSIRPAAPGGS